MVVGDVTLLSAESAASRKQVGRRNAVVAAAVFKKSRRSAGDAFIFILGVVEEETKIRICTSSPMIIIQLKGIIDVCVCVCVCVCRVSKKNRKKNAW